MLRRIPILPTLLVLAAVAVMVRLGFWQLERLHQKEALLERFAAARGNPEEIPFPSIFKGQRTNSGDVRFAPIKSDVAQSVLYRRSSVDCRELLGVTTKAGESARGESGVVHIGTCLLADGKAAEVVLGWSQGLATPAWNGGEVKGTLTPGGSVAARLLADPPIPGLAANHPPDPANIPNNHLAYAVQWFFFALTALAIYALALRKRLAARDGEG